MHVARSRVLSILDRVDCSVLPCQWVWWSEFCNQRYGPHRCGRTLIHASLVRCWCSGPCVSQPQLRNDTARAAPPLFSPDAMHAKCQIPRWNCEEIICCLISMISKYVCKSSTFWTIFSSHENVGFRYFRDIRKELSNLNLKSTKLNRSWLSYNFTNSSSIFSIED